MRLNPIVFALGLVAACGGQSLVDSDDGPSNGGEGGTSGNSGSGTGNAGASGSLTGGSSGASFGGASAGGASAGGTSAGGASAGGTGTGAVAGTGGTGGAAGAGGVCSLPLVTGSCDAYIPSYGFSATDGNCQPFIYGGCEGNDNRFSTLVECEAKCGGSLSECPARRPTDTCSDEGQSCTYGDFNCLCAPRGNLACVTVDQHCLDVDAGVSEIVIVLYTRCTCTNGAWNCQPVTSGGR